MNHCKVTTATRAEVEAHRRRSQETLLQLGAVATERQRQTALWGEQEHHPDKWFRILGEEVGEVAEALNEHRPVEHLREELLQVAAVAVAWAEAISRSKE